MLWYNLHASPVFLHWEVHDAFKLEVILPRKLTSGRWLAVQYPPSPSWRLNNFFDDFLFLYCVLFNLLSATSLPPCARLVLIPSLASVLWFRHETGLHRYRPINTHPRLFLRR